MFRLALTCVVLLLLCHEITPQKTSTSKVTTSKTTAKPKSTTRPGPKTTAIKIPKTTATKIPKITATKRPKTTATKRPKRTTTKGPKTTTAKGPKTTAIKIPKTTAAIGPTITNIGPKTTSTPRNNTGLPTVFTQPDELQLEKANLLTNLTTLGIEWEIAFEFKPENYDNSGYTSILHLTIGEDMTQIGDRIPAIFYHANHGLHVTHAIGDDPNHYWDMSELPLNEWSKIVVSQAKSGSIVNFNIEVAGKAPILVENPTAQIFSDVMVYAADPWWNAQAGSIRGLTIKTQ